MLIRQLIGQSHLLQATGQASLLGISASSATLLLQRLIFLATHAQSFFDFLEYQDVESAHAQPEPQVTGQASRELTSSSSATLLLQRLPFLATHAQSFFDFFL